MVNLQRVTQFIVPREIVDAILEHLRDAGRHGCEGVGFWAGIVDNNVAEVRAAVVPSQTTGRFERGLAVVISGEELFRMNVELHRNGLSLLAQIHSHPSEAYHSSTDDEVAVVTQTGCLSIVVPHFARDEFSIEAVAVYRLCQDGAWEPLTSEAAEALIKIVD